MSSRLVILRHKSWHVWNQDNREKVLRDERLHREKLEKQTEEEKRLNTEYSYELLKSRSDAEAKEVEDTVKLEPFCLFDDPNQVNITQKNEIHNEEYMREKKSKELAEQRKQGIAPMALGQTFSESNKIVPWYLETSSNNNNNNSDKNGKSNRSKDMEQLMNEEIIRASHDREQKRKHKQDPMKVFLKFENDNKEGKIETKVTKTEIPIQIKPQGYNNFDDLDVALLRKKRLEREASERKKASLLLSDPDVNERYRYSQNHKRKR